MTLPQRLKALRRDLNLSQEALGAQGFVSTPGWIKIENGKRQASEKSLNKLLTWLVQKKYVSQKRQEELREELLALKYLGSPSTFVRGLAQTHARNQPWGEAALAKPAPVETPKRGRPAAKAGLPPRMAAAR